MADKLVIKIDGDDSNLKKTLSGIGSVAKKGLGVAVKGLAATSAAVAGLSAVAIKGYAEYEQLVGGVDTLFEKSSKAVQKNAANAYKTAGMSANEYMKTTTSFAASLKQSFEDTEEGIAKAAETADMAVQDMSDNANKMGTDMSLIQTAYQGFAKQNYTMLDNLKLGYGGTKTEMERLLADAQKISGIKYDISNLADVYNAIHVIQTELGITGTTAKEAATTIEGSASMMKASWQNLLVGFADENADFDQLLDNFTDSVLIFGENIIPRIKTTLNGVGKFVTKSASRLMPQIVDVILATIPDLVSAATKLAKSLGNALISNLDNIIASVASIVKELVDGITDVVPALKPLGSMIKFAADNFKGLAAAVVTGVVAFKTMTVLHSVVSVFKTANAAVTAYTAAVALNTATQTAGATVNVLLASTMTPLQLAIGVLTGKISLATAAQVAWNAVMAMNPVTLAIVGVTALTAAIVGIGVAYNSYIARTSEIVIATQTIATASTEAAQKTQELNDALLSISENAETNIMNAEAEAYANNMLAQELFNLSEKASRTATEKQRMQVIVDQLNGSVEGLNLALNNETGQLNMTEEAVKNVIAQKLEMAKANAMQELYTEQLKAQYKAEAEALSNAQKLAEAQEQLNSIMAQGEECMVGYGGIQHKVTRYSGEQQIAMDNLKEAIGNYSSALQSSQSAVSQSQQNVQNLAAVTGTELPESFTTAQQSSQGFFDALLQQTAGAASQSESKGNDFGQGYVNGINAKKTEAYQAGYQLGLESLRGTKDAQNSNSPAKETIALGKDYGDGYVVGIESKAKAVKNAGMSLVAKALAIGIRTGNSSIKEEMKALSETILRSDMERLLAKAKTREEMERIIDESNLNILDSEKEYLIQKQLLQGSEKKADKERLEILEENADAERQIYDSLTDYIQDRKDDYIDSLEDMKDAQDDFAKSLKPELYETFTTKNLVIKGKSYELDDEVEDIRLINWDKENRRALKYKENLENVTGKLKMAFGADTEGFNELLNDIRDDDDLLSLFNEISEQELFDWVKGFQENRKILQDTAAESFASNEVSELKKSFEEEFGTLPSTFFDIGEESAKNFSQKFIENLTGCIEKAKQIITTTMQAMLPTAALAGASTSNANLKSNTYSPTYIINAPEGESLQSTIARLRNDELFNKMQGGY